MSGDRHDMTDAERLVPRSALPTEPRWPVRNNDHLVTEGNGARIILDLQRPASSDGDGPGDGSPARTWRSHGALTTRIHAAVVGVGRSLAVRSSPERAAGCTYAPALPVGLEAGNRVIADNAYDSDAVPDRVAEAVGVAEIPSTANRKVPRDLDRDLYVRRNRVERFFGKIKEFRGVATRYGRWAGNHQSAALLAETRDRLRTLARQSIESTAWS